VLEEKVAKIPSASFLNDGKIGAIHVQHTAHSVTFIKLPDDCCETGFIAADMPLIIGWVYYEEKHDGKD